MVDWLLEHQGRTKPLDEISAPELRHMIEPVAAPVADAVKKIGEEKLKGLQVVFFFTREGELKMKLEGPHLAVNTLIDELGDTVEIGWEH